MYEKHMQTIQTDRLSLSRSSPGFLIPLENVKRKNLSKRRWSYKFEPIIISFSLRKQPTFHYTTSGFPAKWRRKGTSAEIPWDDVSLPKSVLSAFDWSFLVVNLPQPIRSTTKTWVMTCRRSNFCTRSLDVIFAWKPVVTWLNVACFLFGGFISVAMSTPPSAVYNSDVDTLKNQAADNLFLNDDKV